MTKRIALGAVVIAVATAAIGGWFGYEATRSSPPPPPPLPSSAARFIPGKMRCPRVSRAKLLAEGQDYLYCVIEASERR